MRILAPAIVLALAAGAASAQDWDRFSSERFGFALDIPPGYSLSHAAQDGDSRIYHGADGEHLLAVWGADLGEAGFLAEVEERMDQDAQDGWDISYERLTRDWASYSGSRDDQIRYVRAVRLCDGGAAFFYLDYPREDKEAMDPVVLRLVRSMRRPGRCG